MTEHHSTTPLLALAGSLDRLDTEMAIASRLMEVEPYFFPDKTPADKRLVDAAKLVREGKCLPDEQPQTWQVVNSKGEYYTITNGHCSCPQGEHGKTKWCKHTVAAKLYAEVHGRIAPARQPLWPTPPPTQKDTSMATPPLEKPTATPLAEPEPESAPQTATPRGTKLSPPVVTVPPSLPLGPAGYTPGLYPQQRSDDLAALVGALVRAQAEMRNPVFDAANPHFKVRYASLAGVRDAIVPVLTKHGLAVTQLLTTSEGMVHCETLLLHASGQWLSSTLALPVTKADAQGYGAALTYARRYALMGLVCVAGDSDEDEDSQSTRQAERARETSKAPVPTMPEKGDSPDEQRRHLWALLLEQGFEGKNWTEARLWVKDALGIDFDPRGPYGALIAELSTRAVPNGAI